MKHDRLLLKGTAGSGRHAAVCGLMGGGFSALLLTGLYSGSLDPFRYYGFPVSPSPQYFLLSVAVSVIASALTPRSTARPSSWAIIVLLTLGFIPSVTLVPQMPVAGDQRISVTVAITCGWAALLATVRLLQPGQSQSRSEVVANSPERQRFLTGVLLVNGALLLLLAASYGVPSTLSGWNDIYVTRLAFRSSLAEGGAVAAYALNLVGLVFAPLALALGLIFRRPPAVVVGVLSQVYVFGLNATKTSLLISLIVVGLALVVRKHGIPGPRVMLSIFMLPLALSLLFAAWMGPDSFLGGVVFNSVGLRAYFIPALMASGYFGVFSELGPVALGHSVLSPFVSYPYSLLPEQLNAVFLGFTEEANFNANFWADAFANFHLIGVLLASILLGGLLALLDRVASRRWQLLAMFAILGPAISLTNGALITTIGSGGLAACILLVVLSPLSTSTKSNDWRPRRNGKSGTHEDTDRFRPTQGTREANERIGWAERQQGRDLDNTKEAWVTGRQS